MNEQIIYIRKSKYYSSYSHGDKSCRYLVADLVIPGHKVFFKDELYKQVAELCYIPEFECNLVTKNWWYMQLASLQIDW